MNDEHALSRKLALEMRTLSSLLRPSFILIQGANNTAPSARTRISPTLPCRIGHPPARALYPTANHRPISPAYRQIRHAYLVRVARHREVQRLVLQHVPHRPVYQPKPIRVLGRAAGVEGTHSCRRNHSCPRDQTIGQSFYESGRLARGTVGGSKAMRT